MALIGIRIGRVNNGYMVVSVRPNGLENINVFLNPSDARKHIKDCFGELIPEGLPELTPPPSSPTDDGEDL